MNHDWDSPLERELAAALREEADSIAPAQRRVQIVQEIDAARTGSHGARPSRPWRWPGAVLTGGALAATMVGVVVLGLQRDPGTDAVPAATVTVTARPEVTAQPQYPAPTTGPIPAYFNGADVRPDGPRSPSWGLYREYLPADLSTDSAQERVRRAVDYSLSAAPRSAPSWASPAYLASFPDVQVTSVLINRDGTTLTLSGSGLEDKNRERARMSVAALVRTAQESRGGQPLPVTIRVADRADSLLGTVSIAKPFAAPSNPLTDIATSWIDDPSGLDPEPEGQAVAQGQSCAANGEVGWTIRTSTMTVLRSGTLKVGDCSSRTAWRLQLGNLTPDGYVLELRSTDPEAEPGDGYARSFTVN